MARQLLAGIMLALALGASPVLAQEARPETDSLSQPPFVTAQSTAPRQPNETTTVPDPTRVTTEAIDRAKADLKELFGVSLASIMQRLEAIQTQIDARQPTVLADINELNSLLTEKIEGLEKVTLQKFVGVDQNFAARDTALAAALLAQKTAVDEQNKSNALSIAKSDAATAKQIDTIGDNVATVTRGINEKVDDLRTRVQTIESRAIGVGENKADNGAMWGWVFGAIGALVGLFGLIGVLGVYISNRSAVVAVNGNGKGRP